MEDAYNLLVSQKKENESFSEVIRKLAAEKKGTVEGLLKFAGAWKGLITDEEAEEMKETIMKMRKSSDQKLMEKIQRL